MNVSDVTRPETARIREITTGCSTVPIVAILELLEQLELGKKLQLYFELQHSIIFAIILIIIM